jgi:predicted AlkP superfamily phosphohydrolase/phosphomutase
MTSQARVLVIGADGADPGILARMMSEGKLPHLSSACAHGTWGAIRTTFPPVSPVAWMTCLTGRHPTKHGIRDFITKAQDSYLPTIGLFHVRGGSDGIPLYTSRRTAPTLGEMLADAGRTAYVLKVPGTFPPAPIQGGMLAGFGMPDLLGTFGLSAWYTTNQESKRTTAPEGKELIHPLRPAGSGTWRGQIAGPGKTTQGFSLRRDRHEAILTLDAAAGRPAAVLQAGAWSGWIRLSFDVPGRGDVAGMCRFKLVSLGTVVELYRTAVHCVPDAPLFPLAEPAGFGAHIESLVGPYATLGMPSDMDGVRREVVDLDTFLEDAQANWEQQIEMTLCLMQDSPWDLLITHLFTVDNVQHLFWHCHDELHPAYSPQLARRYGSQVERAYCWLDAQVGKLLSHVDDRTTVIVVSDHGGAPIYEHAYVNAWLQAHGYLLPREAVAPGVAARLDWDHTRAAMFGTGGIWINVQGREPRGIVPRGAPYEALRQEIADALLEWHHGGTDEPVIAQVLRGEEVFGPDARQSGPDLVPALHVGIGLGRGEGLGRVMTGKPSIEPNLSAWTGGHEGPYVPSAIPGICIIRGPRVPRGVPWGQAGLEDIAPTVLHLLGIDGPTGMDGRSLL